MLFAVVAASMVTQLTAPARDFSAELIDPLTGAANALIIQKAERLDPPKFSPKKFDGRRWEFDWATSAYATAQEGRKDIRFRVFSQERKADKDVALSVAVMDLRMWQLVHHKYKLDHPDMGSGFRVVDEYLCWGGDAGGEQSLGEDIEAGRPRRANTIYIYDIASFRDPMEMAREVAHEYGHAVLPPVGGFKTPENWANGYLGEKLFLRWIRDSFEAGRLDAGSVMGTSFQSLDGWVKKNVDPLIVEAASRAPDKTLLAGQGQKAMNAYLGLMLYADSVLPSTVVSQSMKLVGSMSASDYPDAIVDAASRGSYTVNIPNLLYGKKLWLPIGKSKVQGGAVVARSGPWAQVLPTRGPLVVIAPGS
jgi:hypothetical protein